LTVRLQTSWDTVGACSAVVEVVCRYAAVACSDEATNGFGQIRTSWVGSIRSKHTVLRDPPPREQRVLLEYVADVRGDPTQWKQRRLPAATGSDQCHVLAI